MNVYVNSAGGCEHHRNIVYIIINSQAIENTEYLRQYIEMNLDMFTISIVFICIFLA